MLSTLTMQEEPVSKRGLRQVLGLIPFEMRISGRRRDLALYLMDRLYPPRLLGRATGARTVR